MEKLKPFNNNTNLTFFAYDSCKQLCYSVKMDLRYATYLFYGQVKASFLLGVKASYLLTVKIILTLLHFL